VTPWLSSTSRDSVALIYLPRLKGGRRLGGASGVVAGEGVAPESPFSWVRDWIRATSLSNGSRSMEILLFNLSLFFLQAPDDSKFFFSFSRASFSCPPVCWFLRAPRTRKIFFSFSRVSSHFPVTRLGCFLRAAPRAIFSFSRTWCPGHPCVSVTRTAHCVPPAFPLFMQHL
jgi:hypothetical protein